MKKHPLHLLGPLLMLTVFALAVRFLYLKLQGRYGEIWQSVQTIPTAWIVGSIALTVLNYVILVGYDWLAVRYIGERLALWKIAMVSFTAYAFSYNIGATFAGTAVRLRLYSAWGLPLVKILQLLVILGLTIWFGLFALAGAIFLYDPLEIPAAAAYYVPFHDVRIIGAFLLALAVAYVGLSACHKGTIKIWRWQLPVPPFKLTSCQIVVASADMMVAASVLYALVPRMPGIDYLKFVSIYMLAYVAAVLSHVPGGYAIFDGIVLAFLPPEYLPAGTAALLIFRIIYYWVPLLIATVWLVGHEFVLRRHWLAAIVDRICGSRPRTSEPTPPESSAQPDSLPKDCGPPGEETGNGQPLDSAGKIRPRS